MSMSFVKGISSNISQRISNPFVNAFIISIIILNYKGLLFFIFSDNTSRLTLIKNFNMHEDLISALILTLSFLIVTFFVWPYVDKKIKLASYNLVIKDAIEKEAERSDFKSTKEFSSSPDAAKLKFEKELDRWGEEKKENIKLILEQKGKISDLTADMHNLDLKLSRTREQGKDIVLLSDEARVSFKEIEDEISVIRNKQSLFRFDEETVESEEQKLILDSLSRMNRTINLYYQKETNMRVSDVSQFSGKEKVPAHS
ncbi:hypothetical protein [Vibrio owensii]|uniref:hypothetical protein n=1 Tax=Vibrio owensii TaxID=696485 RepID=UPI0005F05A73|nr:hypothetical protein [Vibrio owensii]